MSKYLNIRPGAGNESNQVTDELMIGWVRPFSIASCSISNLLCRTAMLFPHQPIAGGLLANCFLGRNPVNLFLQVLFRKTTPAQNSLGVLDHFWMSAQVSGGVVCA